jgi:adenosylhomocysteine nucleosidase
MPSIVAVTGMQREARIARSEYVKAISGGGDRASLELQLAAALREPVQAIVSFGVAGALSPDLKPGDCVMATRVVVGDESFACDEEWLHIAARRVEGVHIGPIAGSETIIADAAQKAALFRAANALAVDMESHIAARAASAHDLPFLAIRAISDGAGRALPPAALAALKPNGGIDLWGVTRSLLTRPAQIPDLIRTARESEKAFAALLRCRNMLGRLFAFPDLG